MPTSAPHCAVVGRGRLGTTVTAQRAAVAARVPELVALFDALADSTRAVARTRDGVLAA